MITERLYQSVTLTSHRSVYIETIQPHARGECSGFISDSIHHHTLRMITLTRSSCQLTEEVRHSPLLGIRFTRCTE